MSYSLREKELICRELVNLCDVISIDISYRKNSVMTLINDCAFKRLSFITPECITDRNALSSPLSSEENRELSGFLYSLGKSDMKSQLLLVSGFKEYISLRGERYAGLCDKNSKLYIALGLFAGAVTGIAFL